MVAEEPPEEEAFAPVSYREIAASLKKERRGPLHRIALFASGVNPKLLHYVPTEQATYSVLGTCVLITSLIATAAAGVATGYLLKGGPYLGYAPILVGVAFGILIFALDRVLVKAQLNPYTFPPEVLHALWNPSADARWYDVLSGQIVRGRPLQRVKEVVLTLLKASPRFLIALATSFVFAEIALFIIFSGEIDAHAQSIEQSQRQQQIDQLNNSYQSKRLQLEQAITAEAGKDDPVLSSLSQKLTTLQNQLPALSSDTAKLGQAQADEYDGIKITVVLSDGTLITTTGKLGDGRAYKTLLDEYSSSNTRLTKLRSEIGSTIQAIATERNRFESSNSGSIASLVSELKNLDTQHASQLRAINSDIGPVRGILIREQALNQLANDTNPTLLTPTPLPPCVHGFSGLWCNFTRFFVKPTPLGPFVAAFRLFFISIELLPILMKVVMSLRRRRPYDALLATIEEVSDASSIEVVDNQLIQIGAMLESRAAWRKSQRSGTGAEFILAGVSRTQTNHDDNENALAAALGRRFESRARFWPHGRRRGNNDSQDRRPSPSMRPAVIPENKPRSLILSNGDGAEGKENRRRIFGSWRR